MHSKSGQICTTKTLLTFLRFHAGDFRWRGCVNNSKCWDKRSDSGELVSDRGHVLLFLRWHRGQRLFILRPGIVCVAGRALAPAVCAPLSGLAFLLVLHPAVLKPDLYLLLWQIQVRRNFDSSQSRKIHVRGKLSFKFQELCARESRAHPLSILYVAALGGAWGKEKVAHPFKDANVTPRVNAARKSWEPKPCAQTISIIKVVPSSCGSSKQVAYQ